MSTEKNCNELTFFEVAYALSNQSDTVRALTEQLREAIDRGAELQSSIESRAPAMIESGELKPAVYDFNNCLIEIDADGECFVETKGETRSMAEMPGYQAWSDELDARIARSKRKAVNAD